MKQIIVPTDFSDAAWNALLYAVKLAEKFEAEILLLNSYQTPATGVTNIIRLGILKDESEKGLEEWLKKIKDAGAGKHLVIKEKSVHGVLVDTLNEQLKKYDDKVIVMGSVGRTDALEKLIGSNTFNVVAKVKCPVFVIPPYAMFSFSKKIVLALDFSKVFENNNHNMLKDLSLLHPSNKIDVISILESSKARTTNKLALDLFLKDIPYDSHLIFSDNAFEALDRYLSQSKPDLLVLVKQRKGLFASIFKKSVTKKLTHHISVPLLVLKAI